MYLLKNKSLQFLVRLTYLYNRSYGRSQIGRICAYSWDMRKQ